MKIQLFSDNNIHVYSIFEIWYTSHIFESGGETMPDGKFFRIGYAIIIIFLIIYLGTLIDFIFTPLVVLVKTLFAPILLGGILYYLFRPFVNLLSKKIPRGLSILILYLSAIAFFTTLIVFIGPEVRKQVNNLVDNLPYFVNEVRVWVLQLQQYEIVAKLQESEMFELEELVTRFSSFINNFVSQLGSNIASFIGFITNIVMIIIIIPFVLFYMLYEGDKIPKNFIKFFAKKHQGDVQKILHDMDHALSSYIQGQIIVSVCVGILCYIGFLIIGLDYSLILALIIMFTNVIPFIGPWIGTIPSVLVGFFFHSPLMALLVIVVIVIVQQMESNIISPQVMGKKLSIHPLTIIFLIIVAGRFAGFLGLILAVPTYAVGKVIVSHAYRLWKLRKAADE